MNYLELDINKLFEQHTIKEVESIQKQIQHERDRKMIELRTLVGERYRDLIQAADTITEMKSTSESIVSEIMAIESTFRQLQQKYLIGFRIDENLDQKSSDCKESYTTDSVVMQVKILMDIPEQIWTAIDNHDFLQATQLYLLAQYINYSMTFVIGSMELINEYPIVAKQWGVISQFKNSILNGIDVSLKSADLETELAANCLASLVLLEGSDAEKLLRKLIISRNEAVTLIVTNKDHHSVRNRIKLCYKALMETVSLIHTCFIKSDKKDGLVSQLIRSIKDVEIYTMLLQLDMDVDFMKKYIPSMTSRHKLFSQVNELEFSSVHIQDHLQSFWLEWVNNFTKVELTKLLDLIVSVKGIYNIREEALAIDVPNNWNQMWEDLQLPNINLWSEFFQPLLTQRVKGIIDMKTKESLMNLKQNINTFLNKVSNEKFEFPEHDLRWFIWKDLPSDMAEKLIKFHDQETFRSTLFLKTRGFSPDIEKLCTNFDENWIKLLTDLNPYLYESQKVTTKENLLTLSFPLSTNKFVDRDDIQNYLQEVCWNLISDIRSYGKSECLDQQHHWGKLETNAIIVARFFVSLTVLCPNLMKCFTTSKTPSVSLTNVKWQQVCDCLKEESTAVWMIWARLFENRIKLHCERLLEKVKLDESKVSAVVNDWEKVTIEEEAEEGKRIKSEILVPYQASVTLHNFLSAVCNDLNKVVPHTLPKSVLHVVIDNVATKLLNHHMELTTAANLRQKQAIQLLFDVKYAILLMVPRENRVLVEKSNDVCNNITSKIDPFDLDVFYPFIYLNVKKAVQRSLLIYGNLVPHLEQLHSVLGARATHNETAKPTRDPPGVLAVCTGSPWFPPLAVMTPARNLPLLPTVVPEKKKKIKEHTRNDSTGSTIKSGAAAFFGAMGSDWFGTS